jgi:hypothetical protein
MATTAKGGANKTKGGNKRPNPDPYRIPVAPIPVLPEEGDDVMGVIGWIMAVVLVALMLPLGAMLYLDVLQTQKDAERMLKKIERLERQIERKERDKKPDAFVDNPVFDRVRRPFSLSVSRPKELGECRMQAPHLHSDWNVP